LCDRAEGCCVGPVTTPGAAVRLHAYVLAADPTWVVRSISAYYGHVARLVVSYDPSGRGWTGAPVASAAVLARIRRLDVDDKVVLLPGEWRCATDPMRADTAQRQAALDAAGEDADWVLQIDTDEVLPRPEALLGVLTAASPEVGSVLWPMRVLFRRIGPGRFLEVCAADGSPQYDYPGPVAVRAGTRLAHSRRPGPEVASLLLVVAGDTASPTVAQKSGPAETRADLAAEDAIVHNSWARSFPVVWAKTASWGHSQGWGSRLYVLSRWWPAPLLWRVQRNLHPIQGSWWPRVRPVQLSPRSTR
jgi:hypothetical protein